MRKSNIFIFLFFLFSFSQLLFSLGKIFGRGFFLPDFVKVYYQTGLDLQKGINPYKSDYPPAYPPPAFFLFYLLPFFHLLKIQIFWTVISLLVLSLALVFLATSWQERLLFLSFSFLSFPVKFTFGMGQINHFLLFFIVLNLIFFKKNKYFLSGLFLSLSLVFKLTPFLLWPFFLIKKRFRLLFWSVFFFLTAWLLAYFSFGPEVFKEYFYTVLPQNLSTLGNNFYYNQSLLGMISRLLGKTPLVMGIYIILAVLVLLLTFVRAGAVNHTPTEIFTKDYALVLVTNILVNSFSWQHHLVFLLPAILIVFQQLRKNRAKWRWWFFLGVTYFLIAYNIKNPFPLMESFWGNLLLSHGTWGMILLWLILININI